MIQRQGQLLVATAPADPSDTEWDQLRKQVLDGVGKYRSRGLIINLSAIEIMDSYATRMIIAVAQAATLRGARTVVVGIQPEVAIAMAQLGLLLEGVHTVLDLEEAIDYFASDQIT